MGVLGEGGEVTMVVRYVEAVMREEDGRRMDGRRVAGDG